MLALRRNVPAPAPAEDWHVPSELVQQLMRATEADVPAIVSDLSLKQRARLAYFCYSRGHLHAIGLAIAATCDLPSLVSAAPSNGAGSGFYAQSRERTAPVVRLPNGRRPITLAKSVTGHTALAKMIAMAANDEPDLDPVA